jgi:hypothetical protein
VEGVQEGEGGHVVAAGLATEQLGVALDAVDEGGGQARADLQLRGPNVLGEDRGGGAVGGPDVLEDGVVAAALGMVVDHHVHGAHPGRRALSEDGRLHVHQGQAVELVQLLREDGVHLDAQGLDHGEVLRPLDLSEGDHRSGGALASEQGAQGVGAGDAVDQPAELHHAPKVREMGELLVDVVAHQRAQAGPEQARVFGEVLRIDPVGEDEHRRVRGRLVDHRHSISGERSVLAHHRELVAGPGVELPDRLGAEAALERPEARGTGARLVVAGDPGEILVLPRPDAAPEPSGIRAVAEDDAACHESPGSTGPSPGAGRLPGRAAWCGQFSRTAGPSSLLTPPGDRRIERRAPRPLL